MPTTFHQEHATLLLKYSGISFISGAVNHGFFSGERSLWTALAGVFLFVAGAWMEYRASERAQADAGLWKTLLQGTLLSIGLGFFTGGLQHFPDSPARSAWVVPLGFAVSAAALLVLQSRRSSRPVAAYVLSAGLAVTVGSVVTWQWLTQNTASRTIEVRMLDSMQFVPSSIQVKAGETVRIVGRNEGQLPHELVVGTEADLRDHAAAMKQSPGGGHSHGEGKAITVAPGQSAELVATFSGPQELQIACLVPGHFEAGMRGTLQVVARDAETHKH